MDKGLADARKEKEKIIREAEVESFKLLEKEKEKTDSRLSSKIDDKKNQLDKEKETVLAASRKEMEGIRKTAKSNMDKAIDFVMELFDQRLNR